MISDLLRKKSLDEILAAPEEGHGPTLKRNLSVWALTALGIGAVIGAGIFSTVGTAAAGGADHVGAGPAIILSFVLTAIACSFAALCYAELSSMVPISGSAYTYSYATLGELVAWIIGWDLIIEYAVGNIAVAISWSGYFQELLRGFGLHWPSGSASTTARRRRLRRRSQRCGPPAAIRSPSSAPRWCGWRSRSTARRTSARCRSSSTCRRS